MEELVSAAASADLRQAREHVRVCPAATARYTRANSSGSRIFSACAIL
jgi:hypothetical protein